MGLLFSNSNFFINKSSQGRKSVCEKSTFFCKFSLGRNLSKNLNYHISSKKTHDPGIIISHGLQISVCIVRMSSLFEEGSFRGSTVVKYLISNGQNLLKTHICECYCGVRLLSQMSKY